MKTRILAVGTVALALTTTALAWTYGWFWNDDVRQTPTFTYSPQYRSKTIYLGNATTPGDYRVEVLYAATSTASNPSITIEAVDANTGIVAYSDTFTAYTSNRTAVAQRRVTPGYYHLRIRGSANQYYNTPGAAQVVVGPTSYYWN